MNSFKEPKTVKTKTKKQNKFARSFASLFSGSFLAEESMIRQLPFIFFLTFLALLYVANGYYSEKTIREINSLNRNIKELKSEYIITKSDLMFLSKQSEVAKEAQKINVFESRTPPIKIVDTANTN